MKKLLLFLLLFCAHLAISQNNGLIPDDEAYEEIPLVKEKPERGTPPREKYFRCPTPGDQGTQPSCVGWALANALTIQRAIEQGITNPVEVDAMSYSVAYIYNQIKFQGDCDLGAKVVHGLELLKEDGDCLAKTMPYTSKSCKPMPSEKHKELADEHKIQDFNTVFKKEDDAKRKSDAVMDELIENRPVIVEMKVPYDFRTNIPNKSADWPAEATHAMVVVGYYYLDDRINGFRLMNSYGAEWGKGGFFEMDFKTFGEQVRGGYVIKTGGKKLAGKRD